MRLKLLFLFFMPMALFTQTQEQVNGYDSASTYYQSGEYTAAIEAYQSLMDEGLESAELHNNLGNAHFKNNDLALAILHFEKSLKLSPNYVDARHNLEIAQARTLDKIEAIPELFIYRWWGQIYRLFPVQSWANGSIAFLFLFSCCLGLYFLADSSSLKKTGFFIGLAALILALFSLFMAQQQSHNLSNASHAIIIEPTVNLNSSPSEGSSKLFVLHEGTKVKIVDQLEGWIEVALPNGNQGWLPSDHCAEI